MLRPNMISPRLFNSAIFRNIFKLIKSNSPEILTALGVSGVISTAYLSGKASFQAHACLESEPPDITLKEKIKQTWRLYVPAGISGVLTIGSILGASRAGGRRTAAAVTAYSLSEKAFSEYREKVVEQIGVNKEKAIRDEIAREKIEKSSPQSKEVAILGTGNILCCELYTNRYFRSDMETLRKAQNTVNAMAIKDFYVTLDEFYDLIGLEHTTTSDVIGWNFEKMMELEFTTVLAKNGEPCLAFDYSYLKPL